MCCFGLSPRSAGHDRIRLRSANLPQEVTQPHTHTSGYQLMPSAFPAAALEQVQHVLGHTGLLDHHGAGPRNMDYSPKR